LGSPDLPRTGPIAEHPWCGGPAGLSDEEGNTVDDDRIAPGSGGTGSAVSSVIRAMLQWKWSSITACALGILLWSLSLSSIHPYAATDTGLVSMLPVVWWLALLLALVGLAAEIQRDLPRVAPCVLSLVALTLVLHGTLPATEVTPRFAAAYTIAAFSDQLAKTGTPLPLLDARMSWPALFSATGMAARAMGVDSRWFLRWAPLVLNLLYLLPIKVIANATLKSPRARWLALAVFLLGNWIDQDYFSPQAVDLLLYLAVIAVLVTVFAARGRQPGVVRDVMEFRVVIAFMDRVRRIFWLPETAQSGEISVPPKSRAELTFLYAIILAIVIGIVASHQFTPLALCVVLFVLAMAGRTKLNLLWIITSVLAFAWFSWLARTYWVGHLHAVFGGIGQVGGVVSGTVGTRLQNASPERLLVQDSRLAVSAVIVLSAVFGFWWSWRRGRTQWTLVILAVAPIAVALVTDYGGEVALRVLLFSLAPASVLIALLVDGELTTRTSLAIVVVVIAVMAAVFPLARYGNESFEAMAPGDVAAADWIQGHVPTGSIVVVVIDDLPMGESPSLSVDVAGGLAFAPTGELRRVLGKTGPNAWILLTRSQYEYGTVVGGYPTGWLSALEKRLLATGRVAVRYRSSSAVVMKVVGNSGSKT
jgi:hypothetical protein